MKIIIDTNIFLDFYRSNNHPIHIFKSLIENVDKIILTDQIIQEFERNREVIIKKIKKNFENESSLENFSSSYLQNLQEFQDLLQVKKNYQEHQKKVIKKINEILEDPGKDPIANFFSELVNLLLKDDRILFTTDEVIYKADKRKKIGNPPTSDKYSIGDEINWEIILENSKDDIIIVGRDNTFTQNISFLKKDYHRSTGRYIIDVTGSISQALTLAGVKISKELEKEEKELIYDVEHFNEYWRHNSSNK